MNSTLLRSQRAIIEEAAAKARAAEPPVCYDVTYDPSQPDADWGGLVRKRNIKKIVNVPSVSFHIQISISISP